MKKFHPPVQQPEAHTAQSNDNIREEQPNLTKTQPSNELQKCKPGRPRKLQKITPLSESEPKEVQASFNMRPMRTRKNPPARNNPSSNPDSRNQYSDGRNSYHSMDIFCQMGINNLH